MLDGQALPYGNKGYRVILDMLGGCFALELGDDTAGAIEKIRTGLRMHDQEALLGPLAAMHDLETGDSNWNGLSPIERGRRMQNAVCQLFETISVGRPLALVAEDMHWVDPESQEILTRLITQSAGTRILLIMTFRPEYQPPSPEAPHMWSIRLDPLSETESRLLLSQRITRGAVSRRSSRCSSADRWQSAVPSGDPVKPRGRGRAAPRRSPLPAVRAMEPPNLPESVRSLLSERIDRLGAAEKDVLQAASVIGPSTTLRLLERVARSPETADICARLQSAGFFEPVDAPEPTYIFHHCLMCEAAYAGLLHQRREVMHARVVDAIEELHGERIAEHVETLAGHAARARHWRKAVEYARRAGQKTASRDANVESVRFYERALDYLQHWDEGPERRDMAIDLHLAIRDPLFRLGRITEIDDHLRRAEPLLRPMGDSVRLGLLHVLDANALTLRGEYTRPSPPVAKRCASPGRWRQALEARMQFQLGVAHGVPTSSSPPMRRCGPRTLISRRIRRRRATGSTSGSMWRRSSYAARGRAPSATWRRPSRTCLIVLAIAERHASAFEWVWACDRRRRGERTAGRLDEAALWFDRALYWSRSANTFLLPVIASSRLGRSRRGWARQQRDRPAAAGRRGSRADGLQERTAVLPGGACRSPLAVRRYHRGCRDGRSVALDRRVDARSYRHGAFAAGAGSLPSAKRTQGGGQGALPQCAGAGRNTPSGTVRGALPRGARRAPPRRRAGDVRRLSTGETNGHAVQIVLIDTTGTIRFRRMKKVAAAIEHQMRHDLGRFYDVDARIFALRHGEELPNRTWPVHIVPEVKKGGGFHSDTRARHSPRCASVRIGRCPPATRSRDGVRSDRQPAAYRARDPPGRRSVENRGQFRYLMEICDPCESADFAYKIDDVVVSDFYTPDYFDLIRARRPLQPPRSIAAPRQVPKGGYLCWLNPALDKMQMLRNLDRDPVPRIHTFGGPPPRRRSLREFVDGRLNSMHRLAVASWLHPRFHGGR